VRIFVAGATGVIGRRLVPMLVEAGHQVTGMTRSDRKRELVREMGAEPAVADVFNVMKLRDTVQQADPEVIVHQLTDLPRALDPRKAKQQTAGNDRIRTEGTANLVTVASSTNARRIVAQSIAFAYTPGGPRAKDEEEPLYDDAFPPWNRSVHALRYLERVVTAPGMEGIVLRYGFFYGPGTAYARDGSLAEQVRRRRFPIVGGGEGIFSFVHVDDAASATVAAIERGWPGIYNVVDDEPAEVREWLPYYASLLGAKPPRRFPRWLARRLAGPYATYLSTELRGASNERARLELGWSPRYPSWREGFRQELGAVAGS
jgi:nucleoside-diphosphate-sugar epimerase